jgi:hypothetical protein
VGLPVAALTRACAAVVVALLLHSAATASDFSRSAREVRVFRSTHPCPSTDRYRGACPGYQVDHSIPLCAGGPDHQANLHWLSSADHRFKTFIDVRECRKLRANVRKQAIEKEN